MTVDTVLKPDFSGWASKAGIKCTDGRTIQTDAFAHQDGEKVPLVWSHDSDDPTNILGHALLENRPEGLYMYGFFNDTDKGRHMKGVVKHSDINSLSIWANKLKEKLGVVAHGMVKEVSLVMGGANSGAKIDPLSIMHEDGRETFDSAIISFGLHLEHEDPATDPPVEDKTGDKPAEFDPQAVYDSMTEDQKKVTQIAVDEALKEGAASVQHTDDKDKKDPPAGDDPAIKHDDKEIQDMNVFDKTKTSGDGAGDKNVLSHDMFSNILASARREGSLQAGFLAHAAEIVKEGGELVHADTESQYGITNIETLFPEAKNLNVTPEWITRRMDWVPVVLNGVRKLPFAKIKTQTADLTHEEARAKGYIKSTLKETQFFEIKSRETEPATIYKLQQLDRDDIIDITEFDVVMWIWQEMRFMLNEELARAILIGDGRNFDYKWKIKEDKIRPIAFDNDFYTDVLTVDAADKGEKLVDAVIEGRDRYKGTGQPDAFMTRKTLNEMLLVRNGQTQQRLYRNKQELMAELEVNSLTVVEVMEGVNHDEGDLLMILVNLSDYAVGTDKGGEITTFDDFNILFNQYQYLIEGRCSGCLTKPKSAQVVVRPASAPAPSETLVATPNKPTFTNGTGVVAVPTQTGVVYRNADTNAVLSSGNQQAIAVGSTFRYVMEPAAGYYFPHDFDADGSFTRTA